MTEYGRRFKRMAMRAFEELVVTPVRRVCNEQVVLLFRSIEVISQVY